MIYHDNTLTPALEDYLETIYLLIRDKKLARVRDIAEQRCVKPGSVVPALKRLSSLGLVRYEQREFIDLTPDGEMLARRTLTRHELLRRFFEEILQISPDNARGDACAMEHYLSDEGVDRLTRFFEFMIRCPQGSSDFLDRLHRCPIVNPEQPSCSQAEKCSAAAASGRRGTRPRSLVRLSPGSKAVVAMVDAEGDVRQRLLDRGLLPGTEITMEMIGDGHPDVRVTVQGSSMSLTREDAGCVFIEPHPEQAENRG